VDADGTSLAKIRWGEFLLQPNGTAMLVDSMYNFVNSLSSTFDPDQQVFAPAFAYTPGGILAMKYRLGGTTNLFDTLVTYRYISTPDGEWTFDNPENQVHGNRIDRLVSAPSSFTPRGSVFSYPDTIDSFGAAENLVSGVIAPSTVNIAARQYNLTQQYVAQKIFTRDECNITSTCVSFITLAPPALPPNVDIAKKRGMLKGLRT